MNNQNRHPEYQYLDLLKKIWNEGSERIDRTKVGTRALCGESMKFDLSNGKIPLFTTKKVLWEAALHELLWFLSGSTNIKPLLEKNVHIWTDWPLQKYKNETKDENITRKEFEEKILNDQEFEKKWAQLGPVYGYQWRKWPTRNGGEIDQIQEVINLLKNDPYSRRILFHAWNVEDIKDMALAPCHLLYQFCVDSGKLNLVMYQRSVDTVLGLPFNIVSCAFLLRMIAQQTNLQPGILTWFGGDTHVYLNHEHVVEEQTKRKPKEFPTLNIKRKPENIDDYKFEDFEVIGYEPDKFIPAKVAV